jgi:hypothetical protein
MKISLTIFALIAPILIAASGCGHRTIGKDEYIETWILATLRAREKGTEPLDELDRLLGASGRSREEFDTAQVGWFGKETNGAIREGIRKTLNTPGLPSRLDYVNLRVRVYLRSRIRGTDFREELADYMEFQGRETTAFDAAAKIWVGDEETDEEIESVYGNLKGALRIDWRTWMEMSRHPLWSKRHTEDWLQEELDRRGVSQTDWDAAEEVHEAWEAELDTEEQDQGPSGED